jgi:hypothetical protein
MLYLMWQESSSVPLETRLRRAAERYEARSGRKATHALVPKGETGTTTTTGLTLRSVGNLVDGWLMVGGVG